MTFAATLLTIALLGSGVVNGAPAPDAKKATCTKRYSGEFTTNVYVHKSGEEPTTEPYYFNSKGLVAFDLKKSHPKIVAEFQTCTPNYAQEPNNKDDQTVYGRFYVPALDKCLAVTNPSGKAPYLLGTAPCPSAKDMTTKKSIPFNFVSDESGGEVDMRWLGATIPSKKSYQGGKSAKYCHGQYFVNSTSTTDGYNVPYLGQPNSEKSEDYRIELYCPFKSKSNDKGTGYNSFLVPPYST